MIAQIRLVSIGLVLVAAGLVHQQVAWAQQDVEANEPTNQYDSCSYYRCPPGTYCRLINGRAHCYSNQANMEQYDSCTHVRCPAGQTCRIISGQAHCQSYGNLQYDACSYVRCPAGQTCRVIRNEAHCQSWKQPSNIFNPSWGSTTGGDQSVAEQGEAPQ